MAVRWRRSSNPFSAFLFSAQAPAMHAAWLFVPMDDWGEKEKGRNIIPEYPALGECRRQPCSACMAAIMDREASPS
jgi:hypothetical protein